MLEFQTMTEMAARFGPKALLRIDPNGRCDPLEWQEACSVADGILRRSGPRPEGDGRRSAADGLEDEHEHVRDPVRARIAGALELKPIDVFVVRPPLLPADLPAARHLARRAAGWSLSRTATVTPG